ncbi:MAG: hypothetical protein P0Y49_13560 [Candidatus Pedobacter colombiensis]|uniref:Lipoprotein n=1 Tax=Candidatus Pedobacter colombiensis TaxID=3121371 RepID=A0AAJ5W461_9SPHI|nr:hypothetical protein [Pedobacter sp.]WEK17826.1 MAG: hypothetical protein P0Y49_13560 [Pedobacter sp.]
MTSVHKQLFSILLSLLALVIACNRCQRITARNDAKTWDTQLEKQMTDVFYTQAGTITKSEKARRAYADCCLSKMKEMFPKGISNLDKEMTDSMKVSVMKMGAECAGVLQHNVNIWEPDAKNQLNLQLYALDEIKMLPPEMKKEYVDCISFKVTAEFPNGLKENEGKEGLQKFINKARKECIEMIGRKYAVPKSKKQSKRDNIKP